MTSIKGNGQVEFSFFKRDAVDVRIVGDFVNPMGRDDSVGIPMERLGDGWWKAIATLGGGEYRFRYRADGHWFTDFASHGVEAGKQGFISVLFVPSLENTCAKSGKRVA